jgi:hypothetical protein
VELAALKNNLVDQQNKANDMVGNLMEQCSNSEEKCHKLELDLEKVSELEIKKQEEQGVSEKFFFDNLVKQHEEEKALLVNKLDAMVAENLPIKVDDLLQQLQSKEDELTEAREVLANDEDVFKQWEGECCSTCVFNRRKVSSQITRIDFLYIPIFRSC